MVELIVVIVLIGILGAIGASRFFERGGFDAASFADQSRALLRYGQKAAIARNKPVYVQFDDNRISLCYDAPKGNCAPASRVPAPGGGGIGGSASEAHCQDTTWYCVGRPEGVDLSLSAAMTEFGFDALGRPFLENGNFGGIVMTVSAAGQLQAVSVNEETGYVR